MKYFEKVAAYEDTIMEKIATRAWKKNYGNLSYENKQKLLNTGVHSYDREHAGLKRGNDALIKKYDIDVRKGLRGKLKTILETPKRINVGYDKIMHDSRFARGLGVDGMVARNTYKSMSPKQIKRQKAYDTIRTIFSDIVPSSAHTFIKKDAPAGTADKNSITISRDSTKKLANRYKNMGDGYPKDYTKSKKSHDWANDIALRHEIDEVRSGYQKNNAKNSSHNDPSVIMRESENVKYAPRDVRKTVGILRQNVEAAPYASIGFRYGKDQYTKKSADRLRKQILDYQKDTFLKLKQN